MNYRERNDLDRYITGNYGEDQFRDLHCDHEQDLCIRDAGRPCETPDVPRVPLPPPSDQSA